MSPAEPWWQRGPCPPQPPTPRFFPALRFSQNEWLSKYETLLPVQEGRPSFVVPRSSRVVAEDNEYAVFTVVLFRRVADDFKQAARQQGFQIRDPPAPPADPASGSGGAADVEALKVEADRRRAALEEFVRTAFSEAFGAFMHACSVRLFVESVLRYGVPPRFLACAVRPHTKMEAICRQVLAKNFGGADARYWQASADDAKAGLAGDEAHPYVSFTINVD